MRVFALSDIHVDYEINAKWVADLSKFDYTEDIIILAGDVSHDMRKVETTLVTLCERFRQVLFVPGNHDIWVMKHETFNSIEKFEMVCKLANDIGAATTPVDYQQLTLIPLLSWYDYSFGKPNEWLQSAWTDFVACKWPNNMGNPEITSYFLDKNQKYLTIKNTKVITFSHFLPRIDVMPSYIPASRRTLYPVLGSSRLDSQIRKTGATLHVYGHSHVNRHVTIDGITYINNAFAYPNEQRIAAKDLQCIYEL